jgi:uncharacterized protein YpmB
MNKNKKSQITIFIVIGIILIIVISFLFFNGQLGFFQNSETKMKNQVGDIVYLLALQV